MNHAAIVAHTIGLTDPWKIDSVNIAEDSSRIDIFVSCRSDQCPICGLHGELSGAERQTWHHNNFFRKKAVIHADIPSVTCSGSCGTHAVPNPWSRPGSLFVAADAV